jgi:hypothetical protein
MVTPVAVLMMVPRAGHRRAGEHADQHRRDYESAQHKLFSWFVVSLNRIEGARVWTPAVPDDL